jgi:hypothetical protein
MFLFLILFRAAGKNELSSVMLVTYEGFLVGGFSLEMLVMGR